MFYIDPSKFPKSWINAQALYDAIAPFITTEYSKDYYEIKMVLFIRTDRNDVFVPTFQVRPCMIFDIVNTGIPFEDAVLLTSKKTLEEHFTFKNPDHIRRTAFVTLGAYEFRKVVHLHYAIVLDSTLLKEPDVKWKGGKFRPIKSMFKPDVMQDELQLSFKKSLFPIGEKNHGRQSNNH